MQVATKKGFRAPCPKCGECSVRVNLADLDELVCPDCDEAFALADVRALVEGWAAVLRWIDLAPEAEEA